MAQIIHVQILHTCNRDLHLVLTKCKSKAFEYGVKFTHVSKSVQMCQFAYISKFAYMQINTHVSKSVHVYRTFEVQHDAHISIFSLWFKKQLHLYIIEP